jgi:hypothetical protein
MVKMSEQCRTGALVMQEVWRPQGAWQSALRQHLEPATRLQAQAHGQSLCSELLPAAGLCCEDT